MNLKDTTLSLVEDIVKNLKSDFDNKKLTGRTQASIRYEQRNTNEFLITIDPRNYDTEQYVKRKIIIDLQGSYANDLSDFGSVVAHKYYGNHLDFVKGGITKSVDHFKTSVSSLKSVQGVKSRVYITKQAREKVETYKISVPIMRQTYKLIPSTGEVSDVKWIRTKSTQRRDLVLKIDSKGEVSALDRKHKRSKIK